jgi:hypothetical protein
MDTRKASGHRDFTTGWPEEEVNKLEITVLHKMFDCKDPESVDGTVAFAAFVSKLKLDPDNYPIFLKLLQFENHWVIDALIGDADPVGFFKLVQPNPFILSECFKMFTRWQPGSIYAKSLLVLFGQLKVGYENPHEGYRLYPLTIADINHLGKHLDKTKDQTDPVNRTILEILDRIASLNDSGSIALNDTHALAAANQANAIRGKFLDTTKKLSEAIPDNLLKRDEMNQKEVAPRKMK